MGQERKIDTLDHGRGDALESRRHRPASEVRFVEATLPVSFRASESEMPPSLGYTKEAVARSAAEAETLETPPAVKAHHDPTGAVNPLDAQLDAMMGDAPVCDGCGHITVRNGACYKCLNCGNSMGCS